MTYVLCKHKKTGSERVFTEPVFRAVEHQYKFISYTDNPNGTKKAPTAATVELKKAVEKLVEPKSEGGDVADSLLTDLQAQYKALTGKEPKKNWGVPRITEEIKKSEQPTA